MPTTTTKTLTIKGLGRRRLSQLAKFAKAQGVSNGQYAKMIIEDALEVEHEARSRTLDEILKPVRDEFRRTHATEEELDALVDAARTDHHQRTRRQKKRS